MKKSEKPKLKKIKLVKGVDVPIKHKLLSSREVIYVFQGGGALGAYQVGAFEALSEYKYDPNMLVGISIGSINAAIIAGNRPRNRLPQLYEFWNKITTKAPFPMFSNLGLIRMQHMLSANYTIMHGQNGFFKPRAISPWLLPSSTPDELSFYDSSPLKETLLGLIDFDYLNNESTIRLCLGSVELESGDFVFFDSKEEEITPEHIMASGALPPGLPPVKIGLKYYVDGGVYSNTPLSKVIDEFADSEEKISNVLCFMVDLFPSAGPLPHNMSGLLERIKDIQYSSHTKRSSALYATSQNLSHAINYLASKMTPEQLTDPKVKEIMKLGFAHRMDIIHLIYHSQFDLELHSKDYEFSVESANMHREMGYSNTIKMLHAEEADWLKAGRSGVTVYTLEHSSPSSHTI